MTDFDQWVKNMGITYKPGNPDIDSLMTILEKMYDLLIDTRQYAMEDSNI